MTAAIDIDPAKHQSHRLVLKPRVDAGFLLKEVSLPAQLLRAIHLPHEIHGPNRLVECSSKTPVLLTCAPWLPHLLGESSFCIAHWWWLCERAEHGALKLLQRPARIFGRCAIKGECGLTVLSSYRQTASFRRASARLVNTSSFNISSRKRPLKLSMNAFCVGLPGAIYCQATPVSLCHSRMARLVNSVPLSLIIFIGLP